MLLHYDTPDITDDLLQMSAPASLLPVMELPITIDNFSALCRNPVSFVNDLVHDSDLLARAIVLISMRLSLFALNNTLELEAHFRSVLETDAGRRYEIVAAVFFVEHFNEPWHALKNEVFTEDFIVDQVLQTQVQGWRANIAGSDRYSFEARKQCAYEVLMTGDFSLSRNNFYAEVSHYKTLMSHQDHRDILAVWLAMQWPRFADHVADDGDMTLRELVTMYPMPPVSPEELIESVCPQHASMLAVAKHLDLSFKEVYDQVFQSKAAMDTSLPEDAALAGP